MAIVLGAATAAQASIVTAHHGEMNRVFALSAYAPLPLVFQVFFTRLLPVALVDGPGHRPRRAHDGGANRGVSDRGSRSGPASR